MSTHTIKVPDVGEGIAEVELVVWHVKPGDVVAEDQSLADVMTDKASVEIPSPVAGRVQSLGGEVGQMLAVGGVLIMIETDADAVSTAAAPPAAAAPAAAPIVTPATAAPHARVAPVASTLPAPAAAAVDRPIASPAVRRRAWELGVDLNDVKASGTAGRIRLADLDAAPRSAVPAAAFDERPQLEAPTDSVETIRVLGLRRRIAMQMQESKRRIPHFSYVEELDVTEAEALRAALNARWAKTRGHLTLLPLLMRAMVLAVRDFPQINARFDDDTGVITRHQAVHLGVATQTDGGLMVPVVMQAQTLDLWGLAAAVARLADAARAGRATRAELSGSTLTISSLGALGGIVSTPVINRPEVAIVAVNRIVEKPVVRGGHIVVRQTMNLSSSFDHRVVDGADAARYVQALRALMETPALLFVG
ncbi:MAG: 2-oxo acid dehydrogenase subunit E2 [Rubrivivax sp.]|nr:2-oxo acid dehydrogenase subunit E2 [Rubrivivax sp.]